MLTLFSFQLPCTYFSFYSRCSVCSTLDLQCYVSKLFAMVAHNVPVLGDVRDKNRLNFRLITKHNKND